MSQQTQPVDERYGQAERLKIMSNLAAENGDTARAFELGCAAQAALVVESVNRADRETELMARPVMSQGYERERER